VHSYGLYMKEEKDTGFLAGYESLTIPCSPLKFNRRFGRIYRLHLQGRRISTAWKRFRARLILRPWRWRRYVLPKRLLTLNGRHGVISQKIAPFRTFLVPTARALILRILLTAFDAVIPNWELNELSFKAFRNTSWRSRIELCTPEQQTWLLIIVYRSSRLNLIAEENFETYLQFSLLWLGHRTWYVSLSGFLFMPTLNKLNWPHCDVIKSSPDNRHDN
jgi:hypothetical protein